MERDGVWIMVAEHSKMAKQVLLCNDPRQPSCACDERIADAHASKNLHDRGHGHFLGQLEGTLR